MRLWRASGASLHLSHPSTTTFSSLCLETSRKYHELLLYHNRWSFSRRSEGNTDFFYGQERINNPLLNRYRKAIENERKEKQIM